ncbi:MAG: hypothetical protein C4532_13295 [Candidatus Abyssobacteria bacterium SURF_17]|uniref:Uncharacterized protein n=1 Tax=Candidatus Abyssobacteria bacterium SURF_17 TaxID=2093361 RepID=A0A419EUQ5_9BACT|nr:MAG: hypothetical protein C4532_13295 [Candidatus Abyssubacteria bacterium SURF_17]
MNSSLLTFHKLSPLIPLTASFWLIYIIQSHKLESKARNGVLIYVGSMGCWAFGSLLMRNSDQMAEAILWAKVMWAAGIIMTAAMLHFVHELLELRPKKLVYGFYGISALMAATALTTRELVASIGENAWGYYGKAGPLRYPVMVFYLFFISYSFILLLKYRYSKGRVVYHAVNVTLIALMIELVGAIADLLPTVGIRCYPAGMFTHTAFVMLIAYGAFKHQLIGVLSRPQPRLVLASVTYSLIASGIALTFTNTPSRYVFVFLLVFLFVAFNAYHFFDDIAYVTAKYFRFRQQAPLYRKMDDASLLFDDAEVGILALNRRNEVLFANRRAAQLVGRDVIEGRSLSFLTNDILREKLMKYTQHRRETVITVDGNTSADIMPIELGGYVGTLICFYPKSKRHALEGLKKPSRLRSLSFWDIFPDK